MATIVRVKRRRDADPLEILHLAVKKQRQTTDEGATASSSIPRSEFKFAGTVDSKDTGVSQKVRDAIRKEKLEKEYKRHQTDIVGEVHSRARQQTRQSSVQNRFTVTSQHRALDLDKLDGQENGKQCDTGASNSQSSDKLKNNAVTESEPGNNACAVSGNLKVKDENGESSWCKCSVNVKDSKNKSLTEQTTSGLTETGKSKLKEVTQNGISLDCKETQQSTASNDTKQYSDNASKQNSDNEKKHNSEKNHDTENERTNQSVEGDSSMTVNGQTNVKTDNGASNTATGQQNGEGMFCLVDMEMDRSPTYESLIQDSLQDQITCNGETMVREIVSERGNDEEYVYDIYYTNDRNFDFRMFETDLTVEALGQETWRPGFVEDEYVYDDDVDDENAESNWRNDYPEEDPGFLDNQETDYLYPEDMAGFGGGFEAEDANQLADWMSWRCNLEDGAELSSDDEDIDPYETKGSTYEAYYKRVQKEMNEDSN